MSKKKTDPEIDKLTRHLEQGKSDMAYNVSRLIKQLESNPAGSDPDIDMLRVFKELFEEKYGEYIPSYGDKKPTKYEDKFCYVTTYKYRGYKIRIYDDEQGQQFYFYFDNESYSCGAFNPDYKSVVKYVVDEKLDTVYRFSIMNSINYCGAFLKYSNHEHTDMVLTYRLVELKHYPVNDDTNTDDVIEDCFKTLNELFTSEAFKRSEEERLKKDNLYFHELMNEYKEKEEE